MHSKRRKRFCVYVGNRIAEIREKSEVQQWKYCPSKENPCDDASRGMKPSDMTSECRWLVRPSFLKTPDSSWPQTSLPATTEEDRDVLIQSNSLVEVRRPAIYTSCWNDIHLKGKIVWLTRFKNLLSGRTVNGGKSTIPELKKATNDIVKMIQQQVYSEEYNDLNKKKNVKVTSSIA